MVAGLVLALVVIAALSCPLMMWLGRRGIGPGCRLMGCRPMEDEGTIESLRARQEELSAKIAQLESSSTESSQGVIDRA